MALLFVVPICLGASFPFQEIISSLHSAVLPPTNPLNSLWLGPFQAETLLSLLVATIVTRVSAGASVQSL